LHAFRPASGVCASNEIGIGNRKLEEVMARKYSKKAQKSVERAMKKKKKGTLKSGKSKKKVTSRKQAIAIGLSEARTKGAKVPPKKKGKKKTKKKSIKKKS